MRKYSHHIVFTILTLLGSCIEPYNFQVLESERALVIDASFTNLEIPHIVRLNYSYPIDTSIIDPISGASVMIEDSEGNQFDLAETFEGQYETAGNFGAVAGRSYRLNVTVENRSYQSTWEEMTPPVPIDSIYGAYVSVPSSEDGGFNNGVQFFIDAYDPSGQSTRFRYEWEEDYRILTPFPTWFYFDKSDSTVNRRTETFDVCFANETNKSMILTTTQGLSQSRVTELPIRFADESWIALHRKYALTVRQFSLSNSAYSYYKELKDNNESAGTFFDKQKGAIEGNIRSISDDTELVLGFFEVAGVSEKRSYFSQLDFKDQGFKISPYPNCNLQQDVDTVNVANMPEYFLSECASCLIVFQLDPPGSGNYVVVSPECADCRFLGNQDQPIWWEE